MWAFYRNESGKCASKLSGPPRHFRLPSTPAPPEARRDRGMPLKTFLPPRRAAPALVLVIRAAVAATRAAAVMAAKAALALRRGRRRRLSWTTQTCSTAARSFPLAGCCVRPLCSARAGTGGSPAGSVLFKHPPSLQQGSGGDGDDVGGGMGFMANTSGDESLTTEDP
ncbi:unnamed protein product [Ectocarpus sp. 12 AP-2014]